MKWKYKLYSFILCFFIFIFVYPCILMAASSSVVMGQKTKFDSVPVKSVHYGTVSVHWVPISKSGYDKWLEKGYKVEGYRIAYRIHSDDEWTYVKIKGKARSKKEIKGLKKGKKYDFKICSFGKKAGKSCYGTWTEIETCKVSGEAMESVGITLNSENHPSLFWDADNKADGYLIYRYEKKDDGTYGYVKYAHCTKRTNCKFTDQRTGYGKVYKYKVRPYQKIENENDIIYYCGNYSEIQIMVTKPAQVKGIKALSAKNKVTLTFDRVKYGDGYKVYRAKNNGKYEYIGKVSGIKNCKFIDENVTSGKKYYYKVRAYKREEGITSNGKYTNEVKVTVK